MLIFGLRNITTQLKRTYYEDQPIQLLQTRAGHITTTLRQHRGKSTRGRRGEDASMDIRALLGTLLNYQGRGVRW